MLTKFLPTQKLLIALNRKQGQCVRRCSETQRRETKVKVPKIVLSVTNGVLNLRH